MVLGVLGYENLGLGFWSCYRLLLFLAAFLRGYTGFPRLGVNGTVIYLADCLPLVSGRSSALILTTGRRLLHRAPNGISAPLRNGYLD